MKSPNIILTCVATVSLFFLPNPDGLNARLDVVPRDSLSRADLLGGWRAVKSDLVRPSGEVVLPYGEKVSGFLVYLPTGDMVVAWGREDRTPFSDPSSPSAEEVSRTVWPGGMREDGSRDVFSAYYGNFQFDPGTQQVTHRLRNGLLPPWGGEDFVRSATMRGDTLVLEPSPRTCGPADVPQCEPGEEIRTRFFWLPVR